MVEALVNHLFVMVHEICSQHCTQLFSITFPLQSVCRTGRLVVAHEAPLTAGFASEVASTIQVCHSTVCTVAKFSVMTNCSQMPSVATRTCSCRNPVAFYIGNVNFQWLLSWLRLNEEKVIWYQLELGK